MTATSHIEIKLSKLKLALLLSGSILFVLLGFWMLLSPVFNNGWVVIYRTAGVAATLFFGLTAAVLSRKLRDNTPGLIIDEQGILDNSSGLSAGLILWRDIKDIAVVEIGRQRLIIVGVYNPEKFINRQSHYLQKKAMHYNYKMYGSPVSEYNQQWLKVLIEKLYQLIKVNLENNITSL